MLEGHVVTVEDYIYGSRSYRRFERQTFHISRYGV